MQIDTTSVQNLVDLRRVLERYSGGPVIFYFASILSPWVKRALLAGGFGRGISPDERPLEIAAVVPAGTEHAEVTRYFRRQFPGSPPPGRVPETENSSVDGDDKSSGDLEAGKRLGGTGADHNGNTNGKSIAEVVADKTRAWDANSVEQPIVSPLAPRFFVDLSAAVNAAVGNATWSE